MTRGSLFILGGLLILLLGVVASAETIVSGDVSGVWDQTGSPYLVVGNITVPVNQLLEIQPGVQVIFQDHYTFYVNGKVLAIGTEEDSINFTVSPNGNWGGIRFVNNPDTSHFAYCLLEKVSNYPNTYGGAFYLFDSPIIVDHCTMQHNTANRGAAMYSYMNYLSFSYNVCWDNLVYHCGGALNLAMNADSRVDHCLFHDNTAGSEGGAFYLYEDQAKFINCTIADNSSPAILYYAGSTSTFENCIFWGNSIGDNVENVTYSDVQGGFPGMGNIIADPLFEDPSGNDYHLTANSPCIDAGSPLTPPDPDNTIADMGAYYYAHVPGAYTLDLQPVNPPIILPPQGGSFTYTGTVVCDTTGSAAFQAWADLRLPDGQTTELFLRPNGTVGAGETLLVSMEATISGSSLPGTYWLRGYLGTYPNTVMATDSFSFVKTEAVNSIPGNGEAYIQITGWDISAKVTLPTQAQASAAALTAKNCPDPFNPTTTISYQLTTSSLVSLQVYDTAGRLVTTLVNGWREAGIHQVTFDGAGMAAGVYLYHLTAGDHSFTGKMVLVK